MWKWILKNQTNSRVLSLNEQIAKIHRHEKSWKSNQIRISFQFGLLFNLQIFNEFFEFQGGFAKCYELRHMTTNDIWAGKIVPKSLLVKQHQREKMAQEITLHKTLSHKYVVKLNSFFEDSNFVYIILELCRRRSLMELHKRRKAVTEPETRYFMNQILLGVKYLHNQKIIHRDLKLGNIFLNDEMEVNILK